MKNKGVVNVYDFDKTIYNGDSTIDFYLFCIYKKPSIVFLLPLTIFYFVAYKMKIVSKLKFKEKFFSFLKYIKNLDNLVEQFWIKNINKIKNWYNKDENQNKIIISASPEFLLTPLIDKLGVIDIIASKVEKDSGKFITPNCYGEEKVKRFNEKYNNYLIENFYSDSWSDIYLAKISQKSYLVNKENIKKWNI